jgi:hypothetical protein
MVQAWNKKEISMMTDGEWTDREPNRKVINRLIYQLRENQTDYDYDGDAYLRAHYAALTANEQYAVDRMFVIICGWGLAALLDYTNNAPGHQRGEEEWNRQHFEKVGDAGAPPPPAPNV